MFSLNKALFNELAYKKKAYKRAELTDKYMPFVYMDWSRPAAVSARLATWF